MLLRTIMSSDLSSSSTSLSDPGLTSIQLRTRQASELHAIEEMTHGTPRPQQQPTVGHEVNTAWAQPQSPGDTNGAEVDATSYTCERCAAIPWESLASHLSEGVDEMTIHESISALQESQCSICQLLGHFLYLRAIKDANSSSSCSAISCDSSIAQRISPSEFCGPQNREQDGPKILVSQVHPYGLSDFKDLEHFYPPTLSSGQINAWIHDCRDNHGDKCSPYHISQLKELKVIDCDQQAVVNAPAHCRYIALSYIWGNMNESRTTISPNTLHELPKTIREAIDFTKYIGYRYLWVDRYCIDQESTEDKHIQIAQMGDIYATAELTIIAAIGSDPTYGLPGVSPVETDGYQMMASPWTRRGWTFQEGILSQRRLIPAGHHAVFVCNTETRYEPLYPRDPLKLYLILDLLFGQGLVYEQITLKTAAEYMFNYSRRTLSCNADALNAIVGALNTLRKDSIYHWWGVPFECIEDSRSSEMEIGNCTKSLSCKGAHRQGLMLSWIHERPAIRRSAFPSWSSIGWVGSIQYQVGMYYVPMNPKDHSGIETAGLKWWARMPQTVSCCGVEIMTEAGQQSLLSVLPTHHPSSELSKQLVLHAETYTPCMMTFDGVAIPFDTECFRICPVSWSELPDLQSRTLLSYKVVLVTGPSYPDSEDQSLILILRSCEAGQAHAFERIGCGYLFFQNTGVESRWVGADMQPLDSDSVAVKESSGAWKGPWWRNCFKPETVIVV
ncbi:hypothetical protein OPT61_g8785 [Boeremia exigua]|uniref:Uncharacterized protein n=1 Tax=Boeremia exigua TaxID=749465 RepID=A0ACC2HWT6_9PLEO|nr:hypothetical protein OPT61_g8785 [Boeremia exigua]